MKHVCSALLFVMFGCMPMYGQSLGQTVKWDSKSLLFDGKRVVPVMGEIHYSRIPENELASGTAKDEGWRSNDDSQLCILESRRGKKEGVFDWSKQRSLRHFLELCKDENLPVVLRIGPFCHGEVRCGRYTGLDTGEVMWS